MYRGQIVERAPRLEPKNVAISLKLDKESQISTYIVITYVLPIIGRIQERAKQQAYVHAG